MNEVDKMLSERGWVVDWSLSTAERVEQYILDQRSLFYEAATENHQMRKLFKTILETNALQHWAHEKGDDEESIAEMVRNFVRETK